MGASQTKAVLAETMKSELVYTPDEAKRISSLLNKLKAKHLTQIPSGTKFSAGECIVQGYTGNAAVITHLLDVVCSVECENAFDFKSLVDKKEDKLAKISIVLINCAPTDKKKKQDSQSQKNITILYSGAMFGDDVSILWNKLPFATLEVALKSILDAFGPETGLSG